MCNLFAVKKPFNAQKQDFTLLGGNNIDEYRLIFDASVCFGKNFAALCNRKNAFVADNINIFNANAARNDNTDIANAVADAINIFAFFIRSYRQAKVRQNHIYFVF